VFGQPVSNGTPSSAPSVCDWKLKATAGHPVGALHALVERGANARKSYSLAQKLQEPTDRVAVPGLGRKAFFATSLGTIWVLVDDSTVFYVQGLFPKGAYTVDAVRDSLTHLAKTAERRIESN
jgi:hypothetical protein